MTQFTLSHCFNISCIVFIKISIIATLRFLLNYRHEVFTLMTQQALWEEMSERVKALTHSHFPMGPKNSSQTKVLSCMDNTGHTSRGDEGFGGQSFLSQLKLWNQVKGEKPVIWFPPLVLSWESGRVIAEGGDWRVDWRRGKEKVRKNEREIKRKRKEWGQQVKREKEEERRDWGVSVWC